MAILFRDLPNKSENEFSEWVNNLGFKPFPYIGGVTPRNEMQPNVAEGAQDESVVTLEPHNEMAYAVRFPKVCSVELVYEFVCISFGTKNLNYFVVK